MDKNNTNIRALSGSDNGCTIADATVGIEVPLNGTPSSVALSPQDEAALLAAARGLEWNDTYFRQHDGVLAVFDFDRYKLFLDDFTGLLITIIIGVGAGYGVLYAIGGDAYHVLWIGPVCAALSKWYRSYRNICRVHLAVTRQGVVYAAQETPDIFRCFRPSKDAIEQTLPFENIHRCTIQSRRVCCCLQGISTIFLSSNISQEDSTELGWVGPLHHFRLATSDNLIIFGLRQPQAFQELVLKAKEIAAPGPIASSAILTRRYRRTPNN